MLEGVEIEKDLTPINNMMLVKKVDVIDQTDGGLFLTGKVSIFNFFTTFYRQSYSFQHWLIEEFSFDLLNYVRLCL